MSVFKFITLTAFAIISGSALAAFEPSTVDLNAGNSDLNIPVIDNTSQGGVYGKASRNGLLLPGEVDVRKLLPSSGESFPPPYGANLFAGGYETERSDGLNDNYLVAPGDKINIWLWGAVTFSNVVTVDNQGNIFLPNIGPVHVADVAASKINSLVTSKIKAIYTNNVEIYVNLLTATPVSLFISGSIIRPGQYAGMASDSILYYLKRAGGIDSERGSYRDIEVRRDGKVISKIDLYDFIQSGKLPNINFKDKDVIFVKPQKGAVTVKGSVRNPFRFELTDKASTGKDISNYARPFAKISHVGVSGSRSDGPFSLYMEYKNFQNFQLSDGDSVVFNDDLHSDVIDVEVSGSYLGPSYFIVNNTTHLHDLLNHIPITPALTDYKSIYILRKSVAARQKQILSDSLDRLESSVFTSTGATSEASAAIQAKEAQMVLAFTEKARKVKPLGKVIVSENGYTADILLEKGDTIVIPHYTDLVQVGGEVSMPQAVIFNPNAKIDDYIAWVGGFSSRADDEKILIVKANGSITTDMQAPISRGDQIIVLPKPTSQVLQTVKDITQIIYQIAVAANVAIN